MKLFILGLVMCVGAGGGIEHLPPTAGFLDWLSVLLCAFAGLCLALVGVMDMQDNEEK